MAGLFCGGIVVGVYDKFIVQYKDEAGVLVEALELAVDDCKEDVQNKDLDCKAVRLASESESKDGWSLTFMTSDGRWEDSFWMGRRGEYDAMTRGLVTGTAMCWNKAGDIIACPGSSSPAKLPARLPPAEGDRQGR